MRYERLVQNYLSEVFREEYIASPWLHFLAEGSSKWRWCQPDGLLIDIERGIITCVEVKYAHTPNAWWQVRQLYLPVLERIFPKTLWELQVCEVVKWFDSAVEFPEPLKLVASIGVPSSKFKVHICRP